jgi:CDGSH-type Zn-finger protein/uncharacterized Fe-S cluster protein YjdI
MSDGQGSTVKRYTSEAVDVTFDGARCIHAAECVRGLPAVFDTQKWPWIDPTQAGADAIVEVVLRCPSGALHFERKDGGTAEAAPAQNRVLLRSNGPLYVRGDVRLNTAEGQLLLHDTRMALCRCGQSKHKPFCDNAHLAVQFSDPGAVAPSDVTIVEAGGELVITLRVDGPLKLQGPFTLVSGDGASEHHASDAALCRCGASANKPFCDASHKRIGFVG